MITILTLHRTFGMMMPGPTRAQKEEKEKVKETEKENSMLVKVLLKTLHHLA